MTLILSMRFTPLKTKTKQVKRQEELLLDKIHTVRFIINADSSSDTSPGNLVFGSSSECRIVRDEREDRKSGSRVRLEESKALQFAQSLQLPVPAVHEVKSSSQQTEILMDFVDGECLEEAWKSLDSEQKRSVAEQIRHIVTTMRQATSDQRSIGAFSGPARDCRQISDYSGGPFNTEAEFNKFVLDFLKGTPSLIRSTLADTLNLNSRIVFTHGDLTPRNIIVMGDCVQALLD